MKKIFTLIIFINFFIVYPVYAEYDITEGYDENTEVSLKGVVVEIGTYNTRMRGPVILKIENNKKIYYVVTSPKWYLLQEGIDFLSNSRVEVIGSKYFGRDGNLYIIGREIRDLETGRLIILRDLQYRPIWKGHRMLRGR